MRTDRTMGEVQHREKTRERRFRSASCSRRGQALGLQRNTDRLHRRARAARAISLSGRARACSRSRPARYCEGRTHRRSEFVGDDAGLRQVGKPSGGVSDRQPASGRALNARPHGRGSSARGAAETKTYGVDALNRVGASRASVDPRPRPFNVVPRDQLRVEKVSQ